jgi:uncharacterized protein (TIGR00369 family)
MPDAPSTAAAISSGTPFSSLMGVEIVERNRERVVGRLVVRDDLCTAGGILHGGVLMALADSLGGICAYLNLPRGARTATTSSSSVFLRGFTAGMVMAVARPLHAGRAVIVVQTDLTDDDGRLGAQVTQTQAVAPG